MFLKTTVSRASDSSKLKYYTVVRLVRRGGEPTHEPVHYIGTLTRDETEGIRNALRAAKNPSSICVNRSPISADNHYGFLHLLGRALLRCGKIHEFSYGIRVVAHHDRRCQSPS